MVVALVSEGRHVGRGECVPYARYGETADSVLAEIAAYSPIVTDRQRLGEEMLAGAARNAIDCAIVDLEAKRRREPAWRLLGLESLRPVTTAYTLSLGDPETMAEAARAAAALPLLKVKLGGEGDVERIAAVRSAAPAARLIVDANEAWCERNFAANMHACAAAGVEMIEQPLPAGADDFLASAAHSVPICADESVHTAADLPKLAGKYQAVNIKLDKAGGLTEALRLAAAAREQGYRIMVGCMVGTSLAMAPALILAQTADFVDLDGPLLLAKDRSPGLVYRGAIIEPAGPDVWG